MISTALKFLSVELNDFIQTRLTTPDGKNSKEDKIIFGNIVSQSGSSNHLSDNIIIASLVNIEEERILKSHKIYQQDTEGNFVKFNPTQKLNLFVLFSAYFEDYNSALRSLSEIVLFFEINKFFDENSSSAFPATSIQKMVAEMYSLNFEEQNQLWGSLGAKYMPSVLFKIRTIGIVDIKSKGIVKPVKAQTLKIQDYEKITFKE